MNIFISHASSDLQEALALKEQLKDLGHLIWMAAEDIKPGVNFAEEITKSIQQADAVVVLLSPSSVASPHVKREVNLTIDRKKYLIPVLLGGQQDFISTLPEDWKYWLTVVQILDFKDSYTTAEEISNVIRELGGSSRLAEIKAIKKLSTKTIATLAISSLVAVALIANLAFNSLSGNRSNSSEQANAASGLETKVIVAKESMMATDYANELPAFPTAIVDYTLDAEFSSSKTWQLRLYGVDWQTPDYFEAGTQMNSCNDSFWILRWRAENPDSTIKSATGYIDSETHVFTEKTEKGGAGYISGFVCEAPFLISAAAPTNYLEDINYELQVWRYKPTL